MSFDIIDRRESGSDKNKSSGSRQKFLKRNKRVLKEALEGVINSSEGITDIVGGARNKQKKFQIRGMDEPVFEHGEGGDHEYVISGNDRFAVGDLIDKPHDGDGNGGPSADGEGEDEYTFYLDRKEFLELLFEDLELPDLVKQSLLNANNVERIPDGYVTQGAPSQLDILATFRRSIGRRIGLNRKPLKQELEQLEAELAELVIQYALLTPESTDAKAMYVRMEDLGQRIAVLTRKLNSIPFLDSIDLRYRHQEEVLKPTISAAMFNIMDVSGSMTDHHKSCAKIFFFLLYMFLQKNYEKVAIIFIRHTHEAHEVDEKEFFYSRETGGTLIAPAIELMLQIARERFPIEFWNLFCAQASDGDSFGEDAITCQQLLIDKVLPIFQYMVYMQIDESAGVSANAPNNPLWQAYAEIKATHSNFEMQRVGTRKDIYPIFRKLFEKR